MVCLKEKGDVMNVKFRKGFVASLALPVFIAGLGIFVICQMMVTKIPASEAKFPAICVVLMLICTIPLFMQAVRGEMIREEIEIPQFIRVCGMVLALVLYATFFKKIGYLLSTFALCLFILFYIGYQKRLFGIIYSAALTGIVYAVFKLLLGVPLPLGLLG